MSNGDRQLICMAANWSGAVLVDLGTIKFSLGNETIAKGYGEVQLLAKINHQSGEI